MTNSLPTPEWVKLIPADSTPVFCFSEDTMDDDLHRASEYLAAFFGERKVLVIRGKVDIWAISPGISTEGASWAMDGQCTCHGKPSLASDCAVHWREA